MNLYVFGILATLGVSLMGCSGSQCEGSVCSGAPSGEQSATGVETDVTADAGTSFDARMGSRDDGATAVGPVELPSKVSGMVAGNVVATLRNSPYTFTTVEIAGNLVVEPGVKIVLDGEPNAQNTNLIRGDLVVGEGASLLCPGGRTIHSPLEVFGRTQVNGTSSGPVRFGRNQEDGYANACIFEFHRAEIRYAEFRSAPLVVKASPSTIRDSVFTLAPTVGGTTFLQATSGLQPTDTVIEQNKFVDTRVRIKGATMRGNLFETLALEPSAKSYTLAVVSGLSSTDEACEGTRSESAEVILKENAFVFSPTRAVEVLHVSRRFGAVDFSGNYFSWNTNLRSNTCGFSGIPEGCGDALGACGGPVTLLPKLTARPSVGPR